jgi:hypothetical protein
MKELNDFLGGYLTFFKKMRIAVIYPSTFTILTVIKLFSVNTVLFQELVANNAGILKNLCCYLVYMVRSLKVLKFQEFFNYTVKMNF